MSGQSEEKIENEADAGHAEQVADGVFKSELFAHIVDGAERMKGCPNGLSVG